MRAVVPDETAITERRSPHPSIQLIVDSLASGADAVTIAQAVQDDRARRNGDSIWPFEYYACNEVAGRYGKIADAPEGALIRPGGGSPDWAYVVPSLPEITALMNKVLASAQYAWPFQPGEAVVDLLGGGRRTQGRVYRVVNCYDGHSGCGAQTWVRTADDTGAVHGVDPQRYMRVGQHAALVEARAGGGELQRQAADHWSRPWWSARGGEGEIGSEAAHVGDDTIHTLLDLGVLRPLTGFDTTPATEEDRARHRLFGHFGGVRLNEEHGMVARAGLRLSAFERVMLALSRHRGDDLEFTAGQLVIDLGIKA